MKVTLKDNYTILTDENEDVVGFANQLESIISDVYSQNNLIIDLLKYNQLTLEEIMSFVKLSTSQRNNNKSFVFVNKDIDYDVIPDEIIVVPTVQEAIDIIEMEEIERDLGF